MTRRVPQGAVGFQVAGGICGLAWAAAMRGWMAQLAAGMPDSHSRVTWLTLALILLPGVAVGALLGRAAYLRSAGLPPSRRLVLAPVIFGSALLDPTILVALIHNGTGGGSLIVVATALSIGYAVTRPRWTVRRVLTGVLGLLGLLLVFGMGGMAAPLSTPHGAWVSALGFALVLLLGLAAALAHPATHGPLGVRGLAVLGGLIGFTWTAGLYGLLAQVATHGPDIAPGPTRDIWLTLYLASFAAVLAAGCSFGHWHKIADVVRRGGPVTPRTGPDRT